MNLLFALPGFTEVQITFLCDGDLARQLSSRIFLAEVQPSLTHSAREAAPSVTYVT